MQRMFVRPATFFLAVFFSCVVSAQTVVITDAFVRAPVPGAPNTSAYMTIHNNTDQALNLIGGESPLAERVELHAHLREDGMMKMRKLDEMRVKPQQALYLLPGGLHLMLFGVNADLADAEQAEVTLHFSNHDPVTVAMPVKSLMAEHQH